MSDNFAALVLTWFRTHKRDLPWRRNRDPYRIWVSEIMLQQTQVKTVVPYFERFIARFPDIASLARADEAEVVAYWSGLGYYSRARNLHRAARLMLQNGGRFPQRFDQILDLPGIGRYTAGAIASIAFGTVCPVVDGNVRRLLSRYYGRPLTQSECWERAGDLLPHRHTGDYNQAVMEIGATVCRTDHPLCCQCPLENNCASSGGPFPALGKQVTSVAGSMIMLVLFRRGKLWIERRDSSERLLKNLWCFPLAAGDGSVAELRTRLMRRYSLEKFKDHGSFRHSIMQYRFQVRVFSATPWEPFHRDGLWVSEEELTQYPHSSLVEKTLKCRRAESRRQEAGGGRRKAEGGKRKVGGGRQEAEGGRQETGGGRQKIVH
ncbi:MAG TPA: A/G-specific adenine glycosylase [Acidobacteriota bacterium]